MPSFPTSIFTHAAIDNTKVMNEPGYGGPEVIQGIWDELGAIETVLGLGVKNGYGDVAAAIAAALANTGGSVRYFDIKNYGAPGGLDGVVKHGATTSSTTATSVTGLTLSSQEQSNAVGKTTWVMDSGGNGTTRTITAANATSVTLDGACGKTVTNGQIVWGTPLQTAIQAAANAADATDSIDTAAGVNMAWGPVGAPVVRIADGTGIGIMTGTVSLPTGVGWDNGGAIIYGNGQTSPYVVMGSNAYIKSFRMDCGSNRALKMGASTGGQSHSWCERIEVWGRGSVTGAHLIELQGLDYQIDSIWTKGGDTSVRCVSATDSYIGHLFAIGAKTGLGLSNTSQFTATCFFDTCASGVKIWPAGGVVSDITIRAQAFISSGSPSGNGPILITGQKDDGTFPAGTAVSGLTFYFYAKDLNNDVIRFQNAQNCLIRGIVDHGSKRGQMTLVNYVSGNGDNLDVELSTTSLNTKLTDGTTPMYALWAGTVTGRFVVNADGYTNYVSAKPRYLSGGTATAPTWTSM